MEKYGKRQEMRLEGEVGPDHKGHCVLPKGVEVSYYNKKLKRVFCRQPREK